MNILHTIQAIFQTPAVQAAASGMAVSFGLCVLLGFSGPVPIPE